MKYKLMSSGKNKSYQSVFNFDFICKKAKKNEKLLKRGTKIVHNSS